MNEPQTQLEMTFTPTTVFQDGWFHPAVIVENPFTNTSDLEMWELSYSQEADAMAVATTLCYLKYQAYREAMQAEVDRLAERLQNPPTFHTMPGYPITTEPTIARGFTPDQQDIFWHRFYYPYLPDKSPFTYPLP